MQPNPASNKLQPHASPPMYYSACISVIQQCCGLSLCVQCEATQQVCKPGTFCMALSASTRVLTCLIGGQQLVKTTQLLVDACSSSWVNCIGEVLLCLCNLCFYSLDLLSHTSTGHLHTQKHTRVLLLVKLMSIQNEIKVLQKSCATLHMHGHGVMH